MGTTQRMTPGVTGQPNWGDLSRSITHIAKTVEQEIDDDNNENQDDKSYNKLMARRNGHVKAAFKSLVKTGGGRKAITSGKSSSIGRAGLKSANKITGFFTGVSSNGLDKTLENIGFGSLKGKSFQDVMDFLLVYCSESNEGMDEIAANKASCEVMNELALLADNNLDRFEELVKELVDGKGLADLLCRFWGLYIFEHLSQRFEEKIVQQKGGEVGKETFKIIKDDILGQVKVLNDQRPVDGIDWKGNEGKKEMERIFGSIIKIICDEDN